MAQRTFEAKEVALEKVFSNDYIFRMPTYQRPYSWTTEETGDLLNDLLGAMDDKGTLEPYFLGSIVLIARSDSSEHEVIDGQQRLTTLTMMVCVLRELVDDDKKMSSLDDLVRERESFYAGREDRFRLEIRRRDQQFFHDNVQETGRIHDFVRREPVGVSDSRKLIFDNVVFLHRELSNLSPERRDSLSTFIITRCYLVVVSAYDRDSAHRIFSVLNARGRDLTPTDILKSEVIGEVPQKENDWYTNVWEDVEDYLGRDGFRELFAHIFVIKTGNRFHRELAKAFSENVLDKVNGTRFVDEILTPYAKAFRIVTRAEYKGGAHDQDVNRMLGYLSRLDNEDWIPTAMAFYHKYKDDSATLLKLLSELDRLAYAMLIMGTRRDPRILRYKPVVSAVVNDELGLDETFDCIRLADDERKEVVSLLDEPIYRPRPVSGFARPLLLRLDSVLARESAVYDNKTVTVEHVLPQSPDDESEWMIKFTDDEREFWTHRLANLVLLSRSKNTRAQNYDFDRKKREYFQRGGVSNFALIKQVLLESEWTPKILKRRQERLIEELKKEWRLV